MGVVGACPRPYLFKLLEGLTIFSLTAVPLTPRFALQIFLLDSARNPIEHYKYLSIAHAMQSIVI